MPIIKKINNQYTRKHNAHKLLTMAYAILIVDDDNDERIMLQSFFSEEIASCIKYFDGAAACIGYLKILSEEYLPKIILTDLNMPQMDGCDLLKFLKSNTIYLGIQVFVHSTCITPKKIQECMSLGAKEFWSKANSVSGYQQIIKRIEDLNQSIRPV